MPDDLVGHQLAYAIITNQFEIAGVGPYVEAIGSLPDRDRQRLLAMALNGQGAIDFGFAIGTSWIVSEIDDLSDPFTRSAILNYVARTDPSRGSNAQGSIKAIIFALRLLAAEHAPLPDPIEDVARNPAWRASLVLLYASLATPAQACDLDIAWTGVLGSHRHVLASLLFNLHRMLVYRRRSTEYDDIHRRVLDSMPNSAHDVLIWSLEHPDKTTALSSYEPGIRTYLIELLGEIGNHRAMNPLRRFVDDRVLGEAAIAAVRAIEARNIARANRTPAKPSSPRRQA